MTDPVNAEDDLVKRLWLATKHGDADHQTWLRDAYEAFFSGEPVPAVRGKGNKERRIAALEAVRSTRDGEIERLRQELGWYATQLPATEFRHHAQRALGIYELLNGSILAEAPWVTAMRRHFAEHGCYRQEDLSRLLGNPGERAQLDENGNLVLRQALNQGTDNVG